MPFILSTPSLSDQTPTKQPALRLLGTTSPRVRSPWLAAIDDLLVLRKKNFTRLDQKRVIELSLRQVGNPYDFNYDIETTDKIVCSQLVYLAYTDIDWPTDNLVGRYTISPDNIAQKALQGANWKLCCSILRGIY